MKPYQKRYDGPEELFAVIERILNDAETETCSVRALPSTGITGRRLTAATMSKRLVRHLSQHPKFSLLTFMLAIREHAKRRLGL
jgi:hypothetical protein